MRFGADHPILPFNRDRSFMIKRFTVKSFKSLEDVSVELGDVNVFIGPNGSGKSNFLEALGVIGAAAFGRVDDEALLRRGVRAGIPKLYKSSFKGSDIRNEIRFRAETEAAAYEVGLFNPLDKPEPSWRYHTEKLEDGPDIRVDRTHLNKPKNQNPEAGLAALEMVNMEPDGPGAKLLDLLRNFNIYSPNTQVLRGLVPDSQQREPVGLSGGRLPEAISEMIHIRNKEFRHFGSDLFEMIDWVCGIESQLDREKGQRSISAQDSSVAPLAASVPRSQKVLVFRDKYMKEDRNELTGYDASEGALYILFTFVLALHEKAPKFLAIDNIDHGLNPRLAKRLMECLCKWILSTKGKRQILLTSHNPLILDGLPLLDDRVRLFTVDRSNQGKTVISRVEVNEELMKKAQQGWTLSRLWVMGNLGGMPNV
jgi:predicted ATPase